MPAHHLRSSFHVAGREPFLRSADLTSARRASWRPKSAIGPALRIRANLEAARTRSCGDTIDGKENRRLPSRQCDRTAGRKTAATCMRSAASEASTVAAQSSTTRARRARCPPPRCLPSSIKRSLFFFCQKGGRRKGEEDATITYSETPFPVFASFWVEYHTDGIRGRERGGGSGRVAQDSIPEYTKNNIFEGSPSSEPRKYDWVPGPKDVTLFSCCRVSHAGAVERALRCPPCINAAAPSSAWSS